jgi:hypothetical protein
MLNIVNFNTPVEKVPFTVKAGSVKNSTLALI